MTVSRRKRLFMSGILLLMTCMAVSSCGDYCISGIGIDCTEDKEVRSKGSSSSTPVYDQSCIEGVSSSYESDVTSDLAACYLFNGNAVDGSLQTNNGTVYNAVLTSDRDGNENSAYRFDGDEDYIQVAHSESLNITGDITIAAWIMFEELQDRTDNPRIVHKEGAYDLCTEGTGPNRYLVANMAGQTYSRTSLSADIWYFVAVTKSGGKTTLYIDGELHHVDSLGADLAATASNLRIGNNSFNSLDDFKGVIDDVRIYSRALSYNDIQGLYHLETSYLGFTASIASPTENPSILPGGSVDFSSAVAEGTPPYSYSWTFDVNEIGGGPASSTEEAPGAVVFNQGGNFLVKLSVSDSNGLIAEDSILVEVQDIAAPTIVDASINYGGGVMAYTSAFVSISATDDIGVTACCVSENTGTPSLDSACWQSVTPASSFTGEVPFTFSSGFGTKTAYVWVRDAAGYISSMESDSIDYQQWAGTQQIATTGDERAFGIASSLQENIYIAGHAPGLGLPSAIGGYDIFLLKYNAAAANNWTILFGTSSYDQLNEKGVTVDESGNSYLAGYTQGNLTGYTNQGNTDIILGKFDASGNELWSRQIGTSGYDQASGIVVDSAGNLYITGSTTGSLEGSNAGAEDFFLIKVDSSGSTVWIEQRGSSGSDKAYNLAVDSEDNIYLTGGTLGSLYSSNQGGDDLFIVKYDSSGSQQWAEQLGTSSSEAGISIAVDSSDYIYVTGGSSGDFEGISNSGSSDIIIIKYNTSGTMEWAKMYGSTSIDSGSGIAVDHLGNIVVTGSTQGDLDGHTNAGSFDMFLMKLDPSGNKQWTRQIGTTDPEYGRDVAVDRNGSAFIAVFSYGDFDGITNAGDYDAFLLKYDANGNKQ